MQAHTQTTSSSRRLGLERRAMQREAKCPRGESRPAPRCRWMRALVKRAYSHRLSVSRSTLSISFRQSSNSCEGGRTTSRGQEGTGST
eukprot:365471-Chlamydomonas_euryale.AAC.9